MTPLFLWQLHSDAWPRLPTCEHRDAHCYYSGSIGVHLLKKTWSGEIRSWESPNVSDEGISLLQDILSEFLPKNGRVGLPSGPETLLRMPLVYFNQLRSSLDKLHFVSDCEIVKNLRLIKSDSEVKKIRQAAAIAGRAFSRINEVAGSGVQLSKVFRDFQALCLDEGFQKFSTIFSSPMPLSSKW